MEPVLDSFFEWMAWPMQKPPSYGAFHLLFTTIGFALCVFWAWKLKHASDRTAGRILFGCGLFLSFSEVLKQFFYYYAIEDNCYSWGDFPFQLCSVPMYMCLIVPWLKAGRVRRGMYSFMVLYNLLGGAISFAEPSGLLHDYWFLTIHACLWHMMLVFVGLFVCVSKRGGCLREDYKTATYAFIAMCGVAFGLNCFVQYGLGEQMNMFFVGPGNSPLVVFKQFSEWFGWYVNTPIYMFALALGAYIVFCIVYLCHNKTLPFGRHKSQAAEA